MRIENATGVKVNGIEAVEWKWAGQTVWSAKKAGISPSLLAFSAVGGALQLSITTQKKSDVWSIDALSGVSFSAYTGTGDATVSAKMFNNESTAALDKTIDVRFPKESISLRITQESGVQRVEYTPNVLNSITLSANPMTISKFGGTSTLSVNALYLYEKHTLWNGLMCDIEYLSQNSNVTSECSYAKLGGIGSVSSNIVTYPANATTNVQSGTYRATLSGRTSNVAIAQAAGETTIEYTPWVVNNISAGVAPDSIAASGGAATITTTAYSSRQKKTVISGVVVNTETESQTANVSENCTYTKAAGSDGIGNIGRMVSCTNNTTTAARSANFSVNFQSVSTTVSISQAAGVYSTSQTGWEATSFTSSNTGVVAASGGQSDISTTIDLRNTIYDIWNGITTGQNIDNKRVYNEYSSIVTLGGPASLSGRTLYFGNNKSTSARSSRVAITAYGQTIYNDVSQNAGAVTGFSPWSLTSCSHHNEDTHTFYADSSEERLDIMFGDVARGRIWNNISYDAEGGYETQSVRVSVTPGSSWLDVSGAYFQTPSMVSVYAGKNSTGYQRISYVDIVDPYHNVRLLRIYIEQREY